MKNLIALLLIFSCVFSASAQTWGAYKEGECIPCTNNINNFVDHYTTRTYQNTPQGVKQVKKGTFTSYINIKDRYMIIYCDTEGVRRDSITEIECHMGQLFFSTQTDIVRYRKEGNKATMYLWPFMGTGEMKLEKL